MIHVFRVGGTPAQVGGFAIVSVSACRSFTRRAAAARASVSSMRASHSSRRGLCFPVSAGPVILKRCDAPPRRRVYQRHFSPLLVLQSHFRQAAIVVALLGSSLVAPSPPRPIQNEIRWLFLCPYQASEPPPHLRYGYGNQLLIGAVVAPFFPISSARCLITVR